MDAPKTFSCDDGHFFNSSRILSKYESTPNIVAQKTKSCAMSIKTLSSISPTGGVMMPAMAKTTADIHDRKASFLFIY